MDMLDSISPEGIALLTVLAGLIFVFTLDNDKLDVIGNVIVGIGGIMLAAAAQSDYIPKFISP